MLIRVIDLETTGFEPPDHAVIEIGWCDVVSSGTDLSGEPTGSGVRPHHALFINPGRPIPPETSAVHHIIDSDVASGLDWLDVTPSVLRGPGLQIDEERPAVLAAHSAKFERQWCTDELTGGLPWICTYKCALRIWPDAPSHSNQALRYWRRPEGLVRRIASEAHRAGPDAYVTAFHLRDLMAHATVEQLVEWSSEPALQVRCHIGKNRGVLWTEVDEGFLEWVSCRDFDEDVLFTVRHELDRRQKAREAEWAAEEARHAPGR